MSVKDFIQCRRLNNRSLWSPYTVLDLSWEKYFYRKRFTVLEAGSLDRFVNLRELSLGGNQLTSLPPHVFDKLTMLTHLSLRGNELSTLPPNVFDKLTRLKHLNLASNRISSLPPGIFSSLKNLRGLCLNDNCLTVLPANLFQHLNKLKQVSLMRNRLISLPPDVFARHEILAGFNGLIREIERNLEPFKEEHKKEWKYVCAEVEILPPHPRNYSHLACFGEGTFLGREGGGDYRDGLAEFMELKEEGEKE